MKIFNFTNVSSPNSIKKNFIVVKVNENNLFVTHSKHYKKLSKRYLCCYCDISFGVPPLHGNLTFDVGMLKRGKYASKRKKKSKSEGLLKLPFDVFTHITNFFSKAKDFFSLFYVSKEIHEFLNSPNFFGNENIIFEDKHLITDVELFKLTLDEQKGSLSKRYTEMLSTISTCYFIKNFRYRNVIEVYFNGIIEKLPKIKKLILTSDRYISIKSSRPPDPTIYVKNYKLTTNFGSFLFGWVMPPQIPLERFETLTNLNKYQNLKNLETLNLSSYNFSTNDKTFNYSNLKLHKLVVLTPKQILGKKIILINPEEFDLSKTYNIYKPLFYTDDITHEDTSLFHKLPSEAFEKKFNNKPLLETFKFKDVYFATKFWNESTSKEQLKNLKFLYIDVNIDVNKELVDETIDFQNLKVFGAKGENYLTVWKKGLRNIKSLIINLHIPDWGNIEFKNLECVILLYDINEVFDDYLASWVTFLKDKKKTEYVFSKLKVINLCVFTENDLIAFRDIVYYTSKNLSHLFLVFDFACLHRWGKSVKFDYIETLRSILDYLHNVKTLKEVIISKKYLNVENQRKLIVKDQDLYVHEEIDRYQFANLKEVDNFILMLHKKNKSIEEIINSFEEKFKLNGGKVKKREQGFSFIDSDLKQTFHDCNEYYNVSYTDNFID